jgi:CBS-domain-containing membrane protein
MERPVTIYKVTKSIYDKKPSSQNVLITCQPFETIGQVLRRMERKSLISLPVIDPTTKGIIATVSLYDILTYFTTGKNAQRLDKTILKVLECLAISGKPKVERSQSHWIPFPLCKVLTLEALLDPFSSGLHRILVELKSTDGITRHIRNISQTDVLRYLYENQNLLPQQLVISNLNRVQAVTKNVVTCYTTDNVLEAYKKIDKLYMSALAVVDRETGELVSTLSGSDLRHLTYDILTRMGDMTVKAFLTSERRGPLRKPITIDEFENNIVSAISRMLLSRTHRLWVVDDFKKPYGVISMSDIFRILARREHPENPPRKPDGTPMVTLNKLHRWATPRKGEEETNIGGGGGVGTSVSGDGEHQQQQPQQQQDTWTPTFDQSNKTQQRPDQQTSIPTEEKSSAEKTAMEGKSFQGIEGKDNLSKFNDAGGGVEGRTPDAPEIKVGY